ncbi:MAG: Bifunctional uridylyltransferase/uridylyl-removing enzyme [Calditrichaeota bacterium]|nr:Bifunctional uridylyltransferase/uridylyl-removing enzyme [Calditrichota bacterium]
MLRATLAQDALDRARARTAAADQIVRGLLARGNGRADGFAVLATGGFARGDLAPGSDLDLVVLVKRPHDHERAIRDLVQGLWDSPFRPAQTVLTIDDLDGRLFIIPDRASSLLETRLIRGDATLAAEFETRVNRVVADAVWREYVRQKRAEFAARRAKLGDVARVVEPHLKNQAGGFRDLHHVLWLERARVALRGRWTLRRRRGNMVRAFIGRLRRDHLLTPWEAEHLLEAYGFLLAVREQLHARRERGEDRLLVSEQAAVGRALGFSGPDRAAMRELMRHVYTSNEILNRFCREFGPRFSQRLHAGARAREQPTELRGVTVAHGHLEIAPGAISLFAKNPAALIELMDLSVTAGHPLTGRARHSLRRALKSRPGPQNDPANWREPLKRWFNLERGFSERLRRLDELDAISVWLPEWREIAGFTTGSYYHTYTVDEHTLRALARLDDLPAGGIERDPRSLWEACEFRPLVYLAIMLHDIAKARPGDHSLEGASIARIALPRIGMEQWAHAVARLVRIHLRMEQTAFRRDVSDWSVLASFAGLVGDQTTLAALYILTVCDLSAVRANVWTEWKGRLLSELYLATRDLIRHGPARRAATVAQEVERVTPYLGGDGADRDRAAEFISALQEDYRRSVPAGEIARHLRAVEELQRGEHPFRWLIERHAGFVVITLVTRDRPGLLADASGLLTSHGIGIREARIFTRDDGVVIDRFRAEDVEPTGVPLDERLRRIPDTWSQMERGDVVIGDLFTRYRRRSRFDRPRVALVETEITVTPITAGAMIDVSGPDSVGLLHRLCTVLADQGLDVRSARVTGRLDGIMDSFLVDDPERSLSERKRQRALIRRLREAADDGS